MHTNTGIILSSANTVITKLPVRQKNLSDNPSFLFQPKTNIIYVKFASVQIIADQINIFMNGVFLKYLLNIQIPTTEANADTKEISPINSVLNPS